MKMLQEFIGILKKNRFLNEDVLKRAVQLSKKTGIEPVRLLYERNMVDKEEFLIEFSKFYKIPFLKEINLESIPDVLPFKFLKERSTLPLEVKNNNIKLGLSNPFDIETVKDVEFITGMSVEVVLIPPETINEFLNRFFPDEDISSLLNIETIDEIDIKEKKESESINVIELKNLASQPPVVRLVNMIIVDAVRKVATDIHIEPQNKVINVRFRIDGFLHDYLKLPAKLHSSIVSRIKIMGKMDIAERRKPQDGGITLVVDKREVDLRISCLPSIYGEKVVIRLLDKERVNIEIQSLGFEKKNLEILTNALKKPHGIILVTGPTGSGKTTTLYAALNHIKSPEKNIITVEDPVEYKISGITQVQVKKEAGLTFASTLRSILRQDPDVILVGEIRDRETAEIAVNASLTGHLVLSTLHTNDALAAVFRLKGMGIETGILADTLICMEAQRLVRKVCRHCAEWVEVSLEELKEYGIKSKKPVKILKGKGCRMCNGTGYKGRTVVEEIILVDEELKNLILRNSSRAEIVNFLSKSGFKPIKVNGIKKVLKGITTFEELARVVDISGVEIDGEKIITTDIGEVLGKKNTEEVGPPEKNKITNTINILIVDDSPTIRAMLKPVIEMEGHNVLEAENGRKAIEVLKIHNVHLIILDLMMPEMNGFETLKVIKNHPVWKNIPVIMLTTKGELENELKGFNLGVDDFMPKPFLPERLIARMRALLNRYYK